jgi:hypothetical protein
VTLPDGQVKNLPIVGGGGEFNVTLGDQGQVIGCSGVWRPIEKIEKQAPLIPRHKADRKFRTIAARTGLKLVSLNADLAYFAAPAYEHQRFLYPVYVYNAEAIVAGKKIKLRTLMLPATDFGADITEEADQPPRPGKDMPRPGGKKAGPPAAGASWLPLLGACPTGFLSTLQGTGWTVGFNHGGSNALESDWDAQAESWVDKVKIVYYCGHAEPDYWILYVPVGQQSSPVQLTSEMVDVGQDPMGRLWGKGDLKWIVVNACGPLQDDILTDVPGQGNNAFRWKGAFDGLHQLLGFASTCIYCPTEGQSFALYCLPPNKDTLIHAWFRAAKESQPCTLQGGIPVYAAAMYAECSGQASPGDDHLWGQGPVAVNPVVPDAYVIIWTPT